jgi:hypothetical protein
MKRGPKPVDPETQKARGETRGERVIIQMFPDIAARPDPEEMPPPEGMTLEGELIWIEKVERYKRRGQKIQGFESTLRIYCEAEAALLKQFAAGQGASSNQINAVRGWANEFYDTPASQRISVRAAGGGNGNKFAANGNRKPSP